MRPLSPVGFGMVLDVVALATLLRRGSFVTKIPLLSFDHELLIFRFLRAGRGRMPAAHAHAGDCVLLAMRNKMVELKIEALN